MKNSSFSLKLIAIFVGILIININASKLKTKFSTNLENSNTSTTTISKTNTNTDSSSNSSTSIKTETNTSNSTQNTSKSTTNTKLCGAGCIDCSDYDSNYCNKCVRGTAIYHFSCYDTCPLGTYYRTRNSCDDCDPKCPVCWGPNNDQCGLFAGMSSNVLVLEDEIKNYFSSQNVNKIDVDRWFGSISYIIKNDKDTNNKSSTTMNNSQVYGVFQNDVDLPFGSFSYNDGVYIPVPNGLSYTVDRNNSHWVYRKGQWDGKAWQSNWFPRLPLFIREKGNKMNIYEENNGYWVYSQEKGWFWVKSKNIRATENETNKITKLNTVKMNISDFDKKWVEETLEMKRIHVKNYIKEVFDQFSSSQLKVFEGLKQHLGKERTLFNDEIKVLKNEITNYFGEGSIKSSSTLQDLKKLIDSKLSSDNYLEQILKKMDNDEIERLLNKKN